MAKYKVEIEGFVTVLRHRDLIIHAQSEEEAKEKAIDKFVSLQMQSSGDLDDKDVIIDNIEKL